MVRVKEEFRGERRWILSGVCLRAAGRTATHRRARNLERASPHEFERFL